MLVAGLQVSLTALLFHSGPNKCGLIRSALSKRSPVYLQIVWSTQFRSAHGILSTREMWRSQSLEKTSNKQKQRNKWPSVCLHITGNAHWRQIQGDINLARGRRQNDHVHQSRAQTVAQTSSPLLARCALGPSRRTAVVSMSSPV